MEEAVNERRKAFVAAHRSDEDRQAYTYASRQASPGISMEKAEAWQEACSFLSPKSVYSLLHSVAGSSFPSFSFSNFPDCSFPRTLVSVFSDYLRSHFSVS